MKVKDLISEFSYESISLPDGEREISGVYIGDLLSWVMGRAKSNDVWITIMSNINIVAVATLSDVACIILSEDVKIDKEIVDTAISKGVNILSSNKTSFAIAAELSKIIP